MTVVEIRLLESVLLRLSAAADFEQSLTLEPTEALVLLKWVRSEKYRHRR